MKKTAFVISILLGCSLLAGELFAGSEKEANAIAEAKTWLALVDAGDYEASWKEASTLFRSAVDQAGWKQALGATRTPLGNLVSREVKSAEFATSLPGAPDGEYVVIQFNTKFEKKETAVETVTPMLDEEGNWKVSGYYIR
jgi:hypothetical protein